jgi:hypothetical protein
VPGFCLHDELEWFTRAVFSPPEAPSDQPRSIPLASWGARTRRVRLRSGSGSFGASGRRSFSRHPLYHADFGVILRGRLITKHSP